MAPPPASSSRYKQGLVAYLVAHLDAYIVDLIPSSSSTATPDTAAPFHTQYAARRLLTATGAQDFALIKAEMDSSLPKPPPELYSALFERKYIALYAELYERGYRKPVPNRAQIFAQRLADLWEHLEKVVRICRCSPIKLADEERDLELKAYLAKSQTEVLASVGRNAPTQEFFKALVLIELIELTAELKIMERKVKKQRDLPALKAAYKAAMSAFVEKKMAPNAVGRHCTNNFVLQHNLKHYHAHLDAAYAAVCEADHMRNWEMTQKDVDSITRIWGLDNFLDDMMSLDFGSPNLPGNDVRLTFTEVDGHVTVGLQE